MQINLGGRLNTRDVMGRDNEIARYWRVLERQGLVISAERRIGKTHIVLKMRDECRGGFLSLYQDLEAVHSTAELIRSIYGTVHQSLSCPVSGPTSPNGLPCFLTRSAASTCRRAPAPGRTMAGQVSPTPVAELLNLCKHRDPSLTDEQLREILTALAEDHYIEPTKCAGGAAYDFRWQLVKNWWKERRS